jgi:RecA-family ATPase
MEEKTMTPISKDEFKGEIEKFVNNSAQTNNLLLVKDANEWIAEAKERPIPNMLFDEFWREGEVCILFADTNVGKSILAVQIAESISSGNPIKGFKMESPKTRVILFDFELSDKQFESRYSENYTNHYSFDKNFKRVEINPDAEIPEHETFETYLCQCLEAIILKTGAKILIVDNITYLKNETEKAKDAASLMKMLKMLKNKYFSFIAGFSSYTQKR